MKRIFCLGLVILTILMLAACSGQTEQSETEQTQQQTVDTWEGPTPVDEAMEFIGCPVEELLERLGPPSKIEYYPSPMSEGTDEEIQEGYYYYDGFTVITLKEGAGETVYNVEY